MIATITPDGITVTDPEAYGTDNFYVEFIVAPQIARMLDEDTRNGGASSATQDAIARKLWRHGFSVTPGTWNWPWNYLTVGVTYSN